MTRSCKIPSIVIEGTDGTGKSTVTKLLTERLNASDIPAILVRSIGGTTYAEEIRDRLVTGNLNSLSSNTRATLVSSAFFETIDAVIKPKNAEGVCVVLDRYCDSMRLYQKDSYLTENLANSIEEYYPPTYTFFLDAEPELIKVRMSVRGSQDAMDTHDVEEIAARRKQYLDIHHNSVKRNPNRSIVLMSTDKSPEQIVEDILTFIFSKQEGALQ